MIILYTKNLQQFLGFGNRAIPLPEFSNPDALWHGNIFKYKRKNVLHLCHELSRYTIFINGLTKKDLKNLPEIINEHLSYHILKDQIPLRDATYVVSMLKYFSYYKKTNKKVLGTMANQKQVFEILGDENEVINDKELSHDINHLLIKIDGKYIHSYEAFKEYISFSNKNKDI